MTPVSLLDFRDVLVARVEIRDHLPAAVLFEGRVFVAPKDDPVRFREVTVATPGVDERARLVAAAELANALRGEALAMLSGGQLEGHDAIGEAWTRARRGLADACKAWLAAGAAAALLAACSVPWSSSPDGQRVGASLNLAVHQLHDCDRDGGTCTPGDIRATAAWICRDLAAVSRDHGVDAGCP